MDVTLVEIALLLAAAAVAAPLAKWLRIGTVLGYLLAGLALGPYGIGAFFSVYKANQILHIAEFGIVLLLFLIGLELRPKRLWSMRTAIFGLGGSQVALTALALSALGVALGLGLAAAVFTGLALALSSTAFALQVLEERGELTARHGRLGFAVLLFQDLAAIPLIALAPLFALGTATGGASMDLIAAGYAVFTIVAVVVVGRIVLARAFHLVARTRVKEAMTATALLTVILIAVVMQEAALSASLGAFIAGALLSESAYRHEIEADIQPFQGLLLGLFFTAIGMSLNLGLLLERPHVVAMLVATIVLVKAALLYGLARAQGLEAGPARRLGIALSQGGEFAFVLFAAGVAAGLLARAEADLLAVVVTLSMAATPLLLLGDDLASWLWRKPAPVHLSTIDAIPDADRHVVIAGFGRYGQIVARVLRAKGIAFTALDIDAEQIALVERFGAEAFFGDASRPEILDAARTEKARAFVIAVDDVEASVRIAEIVKARFPDVPILARARDRSHAHRLIDIGITSVQRETFLSALDTTRNALRLTGLSEAEAQRTVAMFRGHDERRLVEDYKHSSDLDRMIERSRSDLARLEKLFAEDVAEAERAARRASGASAGAGG